MKNTKKILNQMFARAYKKLGRQHWWPGETPLEIAVGAVLTQNTAWTNVEKAIRALKQKNLISEKKLHTIPAKKLAVLIKPCGYYNIKTKRLKNFIRFLVEDKRAKIEGLKKTPLARLRRELLAVNGIGPETADSILLYALNKPSFVVDAYTKRILERHGIIGKDAEYHEVQDLFARNIPKKTSLYNEYHALIVAIGKNFCLSKVTKCAICPLNMFLKTEHV